MWMKYSFLNYSGSIWFFFLLNSTLTLTYNLLILCVWFYGHDSKCNSIEFRKIERLDAIYIDEEFFCEGIN